MAHILLTSGPTRAYLDDVRYLSNGSSGRMGAALAAAALEAGHRVSIVSGPVAVDYPQAARVSRVTTTREMLEASLALLPKVDGVIAAAAPPATLSRQPANSARFHGMAAASRCGWCRQSTSWPPLPSGCVSCSRRAVGPGASPLRWRPAEIASERLPSSAASGAI